MDFILRHGQIKHIVLLIFLNQRQQKSYVLRLKSYVFLY